MVISRDECPFMHTVNEVALLITLFTQLAINIVIVHMLPLFVAEIVYLY